MPVLHRWLRRSSALLGRIARAGVPVDGIQIKEAKGALRLPCRVEIGRNVLRPVPCRSCCLPLLARGTQLPARYSTAPDIGPGDVVFRELAFVEPRPD
jgi:hypothetical protein